MTDFVAYRVLVTGTRRPLTAADSALVVEQLLAATHRRPSVVVVHGACPTGLDAFVANWVKEQLAVRAEPYPAEDFGPWPACGPRRNTHMVSLGADLCLGFPGPKSRGTWDCLSKAVDAGIPMRAYSLGGAR